MNSILLDTNAYTGLINGDIKVCEYITQADIVYMSAIVLGELYAGFYGGSKPDWNANMLHNFLEKKTIMRYAISIGGNETASIMSGISVLKMRMIFFFLSGVMAALSGVYQVARLGSSDPTIGIGMEFNVIVAVILGGVNIKGGEGSVIGVFLGSLILMVLINGMQMMGIGSFYQTLATGIVLYIAVLLNVMIAKFSGRKIGAIMAQKAA
jgi:ABC-type glucose/galactose transport system permease subunit